MDRRSGSRGGRKNRGVRLRCLEVEGLWLLPGEALVGEVTVLGGLEVDRLGEVEVLDDDTRTEVKVLSDDVDELIGSLARGAVGLDKDGEGLGNTDGVGKLDEGTAGELRVDDGLGDPSGDVGSRAVDLGVVLSGESTATVGTPTTVGVDDDLTASETGVTLGTADDEEARWLDVVDGAVVEKVGWDDLLDDLLEDLLSEDLGSNFLTVLSTDDDSVDADGLDGAVVMGVLNGDLGLGVGAEPWEGAVLAGILHGTVELVGKLDGQWEEFRGLVGGISEHDTLVTSTQLLQGLIVVKTLSNVGGLLLDGNKDVAGLVVKALGRVIVSDVLDGITNDLLVVKTSLGGDLTEDHDHAYGDGQQSERHKLKAKRNARQAYTTYRSWWQSRRQPVIFVGG